MDAAVFPSGLRKNPRASCFRRLRLETTSRHSGGGVLSQSMLESPQAVDSLDDWFSREILVHERVLFKFLMRVWPDKSEVDDLCQETFVRVYESAARERPAQPRGFLFATARHLMIDKVRHGRIVSIEMRGNIDALDVLIDELSPEHRVSAGQDLWRLAQAFASLPAICRDIVWMMKVEDITQSEIARRMGVPRKTVEKRALRGFRQLQEAYFGGTGVEEREQGPVRIESESDHG